jgi:hypothetical protein
MQCKPWKTAMVAAYPDPSDSLIKLESSAKLPRSFLSTLMLESKRLLSAQS